MMKADQERVKSLLIDTVTLLCKNSLEFQSELCIEGLLGVKVDASDVFFVHISESFTSLVGMPHGAAKPHGAKDTGNIDVVPSQTIDSNSKPLDTQKHSTKENEVVVIHSPETVAKPVPVLAGQRRVPRKPSSPQRSLTLTSGSSPKNDIDGDFKFHMVQNVSDVQQHHSINRSGSELETARDVSGVTAYASFDSVGKREGSRDFEEPPLKKAHTGNEGVDSNNAYLHDHQGTPWPNIAGNLELAAQSSSFVDSEDTDLSADVSQPGCSTWPIAGQPLATGPTAVDMVVPHPHFVMAAPEGAQILTPPRYSPAAMQNAVRKMRQVQLEGKLYKCDKCSYTTKRLWNLQRHMRKHWKDLAKCPLCAEACFMSDDQLRQHVQSAHQNVDSVRHHYLEIEKHLSGGYTIPADGASEGGQNKVDEVSSSQNEAVQYTITENTPGADIDEVVQVVDIDPDEGDPTHVSGITHDKGEKTFTLEECDEEGDDVQDLSVSAQQANQN